MAATRSVFVPRKSFKPYEYPEIEQWWEAIQHSYWLVSEFNFTADVQDFHTRLNQVEQSAIKNTLLAISQIEVSVKRFWAKLGDRLPKPEFEQAGIVMAECHVDGTEILTPTGWVNLKDVQVGDEVVQYNVDRTLSIVPVQAVHSAPYSGPMHRFHKRTTETIVTPNHRMLVYHRKNGCTHDFTADELPVKSTDLKLPEAGQLLGEEHCLTFRERLNIAIQADGNRRYYNSGYGRKPRKGCGYGAEYEVRIQKPRKVARMDWILENIPGIFFTKSPIPSRPGMYCYTLRVDDTHDYKTLDWVSLKGKSYSWAESFIQELAEWDGTRLPQKKDCLVKFSTTSKRVADIAQLVGVAAGYRTHLGVHKDNRKASFNDCYIVSFTANRELVTLAPLKREVVQYEGVVRCVTVQSGYIITRYNNKTFIAGNSEIRHAEAYSHLLKILGLDDQFSMLMQNPVIQGRVDYMTKYLKGDGANSNESFTLTLALFSLFIENVSLFCQFAIIKSFAQKRNVLRHVDNVVQATQREELLHAKFGAALLHIIKRENPEWFHEEFTRKLNRACKKAYAAESKILDWIFEAGELDFITKADLDLFLKDRFNQSLQMIGVEPLFPIDRAALHSMQWFEDEMNTETAVDFFSKKSTAYSKRTVSIGEDDLF